MKSIVIRGENYKEGNVGISNIFEDVLKVHGEIF
jgi:hypothetical protein